MAEYVWIGLDKPEYVWIYDSRQGSQYVLYNILRKVTLQVISFYWHAYSKPVQKFKMECLGKTLQFLTIFAKTCVLIFWEGCEYVLGFKYVRGLNVCKFS